MSSFNDSTLRVRYYDAEREQYVNVSPKHVRERTISGILADAQAGGFSAYAETDDAALANAIVAKLAERGLDAVAYETAPYKGRDGKKRTSHQVRLRNALSGTDALASV